LDTLEAPSTQPLAEFWFCLPTASLHLPRFFSAAASSTACYRMPPVTVRRRRVNIGTNSRTPGNDRQRTRPPRLPPDLRFFAETPTAFESTATRPNDPSTLLPLPSFQVFETLVPCGSISFLSGFRRGDDSCGCAGGAAAGLHCEICSGAGAAAQRRAVSAPGAIPHAAEPTRRAAARPRRCHHRTGG
jgi:hypothetical protein